MRAVNEVGNVYSRLKVISFADSLRGAVRWNCICECGNSVIVEGCDLRSAHTKSCGCLIGGGKNEIGKRYGRLIVKSLSDMRSKEKRLHWVCLCDCGVTTIVSGKDLRSGHTVSCGCYGLTKSLTHGHCSNKIHTREYNAWNAMKERCGNPKTSFYHRYGGRGITICDRWINSFENFLEDMGPKPDGTSLDRKDVNGAYSKSNCRWATSIEQANNTTRSRILSFNGLTMTVSQWARHIGVGPVTLFGMLRAGWTIERCLTEPLNINSSRKLNRNV